MKLVFASDSFKGSLTSEKTGELLTKAAKEVFVECETITIPVADGGEGTIDAVIKADNGERVYINVHDPLMRPVNAYYGKTGDRAVIEMAQASGLNLVPAEKRNPLNTTSYGTGEIVRAALDEGLRDIVIAIGGSATNDGGMGFAAALGVKFFDIQGNILEGYGRELEQVSGIDLSELDPRINDARFTVMCDVTNPLCGVDGATYTFGKQKGGTPEILDRLEKGMQNYREVLIREFGIDPNEHQGTGAAGGLGAALLFFLKAKMISGIDAVLNMTRFDDKIRNADLIVTGEGRSDAQSCFGKVVQGVGDRAKLYGIPAVVICGSLGDGYEGLYDHGISSFMTTIDRPMTVECALEHAEELYYSTAIRLFRMIRAGI